MKVWECKIGMIGNDDIPRGADAPFRAAVERAFKEMFGRESDFCFSGWGAELTDGELRVILPDLGKR